MQYSDEGPRLPWSGLSTIATLGPGLVITRRSAPRQRSAAPGSQCGVRVREVTSWTNGTQDPSPVFRLSSQSVQYSRYMSDKVDMRNE